MKTTLKIITLLLLLINGAGAIYGGYHLISHPDGSSLQMSPEWLEPSPFSSYFIPGIILLVCNGLFSFVVIGSAFLHYRHYYLLIIAQGAILSGWILVQMIMLQIVAGIQVVFGSIGLLIILLGFFLGILERQRTAA